jgi:hypothetical protein
MVAARFHCPECDALLKPSALPPAGKKFSCPKCGSRITVPSPEVDEPDELDELDEIQEDEPATRRDTRRASQRRPPAGRDDDDDQDERPSRRKTRTRKKAKRGGSGLLLGLVLGAVLLGVVLLGVGGYFLVSFLPLSPVRARVQAHDEATAALAGVQDQASADAAKPRLLRAAGRLREFDEQDMAALKKGLKKLEEDPEAIRKAIEEAMKNPEKAKRQAEKMEKEQQPLAEAKARLMKEVVRVQKVPGGKELLAAFFEAWGPGSNLVKMAASMTDWGGPGFGGNRPAGNKGR